MAKILAFQLPVPELEKVKKAAGGLKLRVETVPVMLYRQSIRTLSQKQIGSLVETVQMGAEEGIFTGEPPQESLLVFCGLEGKALDKLLAALQRNTVQADYKAVLTPTNGGWSVLRLYVELQREKRGIEGAKQQ